MEYLFCLVLGIFNLLLLSQSTLNPGIILFLWLIPGLLSSIVAANKRRNAFLWAIFGLLGGILASIILLTLKGQRTCPNPACKKQVPSDARICGHCGRDLL